MNGKYLKFLKQDMKGPSQRLYSRMKRMTENGKMNGKQPTIIFAICILKVKTKNILLT